MKIPYGISNFGRLRRDGFFYVDKTPFLPILESGETGYQHLLFLRPRRIGKSLLLSMMEHYYDVGPRPELAGQPELADRTVLLDVLERHYDGYRFYPGAPERIFNSDMVLYFLRELAALARYPDDMLDHNVRTEYQHLVRIGALTGTGGAARRALLETILSEEHIEASVIKQFGVGSLSSVNQFISLLYFLGTGAKPAQIEAAFAAAERQVERYASDAALVTILSAGKELKAGSLVFVGAKKVLFRPWPREKKQASRGVRRAGARRSSG